MRRSIPPVVYIDHPLKQHNGPGDSQDAVHSVSLIFNYLVGATQTEFHYLVSAKLFGLPVCFEQSGRI